MAAPLPMVKATIFSLSAQQLGSRPHGRSFWRLRGACHLASSPIDRIGAVTCRVWFVSLPCPQFPTAPLGLLPPVDFNLTEYPVSKSETFPTGIVHTLPAVSSVRIS